MQKTAIKIPVFLLSLALTIWLSIDMMKLAKIEALWGYRPLWIFCTGWLALVSLYVILKPRLVKRVVNGRYLGLSTLSGVLMALGFPGLIPFPFLVFVGFVPLLWLEKELSASPKPPRRFQFFVYSYNAFLVWNILSTYWVANSAFAAGFFAIVVNSLLMTIPLLLFRQTKKKVPRLAFPALIAYWICYELLHYHWDLSWPWLTLGNSFAQFPSLVQWYEYTGLFGGSLWVLLLNIIIFQILEHRKNKTAIRKQLINGGLLLILPIIFSLFTYFSYQEKGKIANVTVVQPNYEAHYEKFDIPEAEQMRRFLKLSKEHVNEQTDYLVYPETSFGYIKYSQMESYHAIRSIRDFMVDYPELKMVSGVDIYHDFLPGEAHSDAVRVRVNSRGDSIYYEIFNAAIQLEMGNSEFQLHKKSKLVPGPEIFPFKKTFFFFEPLVKKLGGTTAGLATQKEPSVFSSEKGKVAPVICYESVYGQYLTGYIRKGAEAIFIMTNDGWWDNTAGHRQHLIFASLRAIETRRSVARSANTGISGFINQRGDVLETLPYGVAGALNRDIQLNDSITFYVKWGDMIARLCLFLGALLVLNTIMRSIKGEDGEAQKE